LGSTRGELAELSAERTGNAVGDVSGVYSLLWCSWTWLVLIIEGAACVDEKCEPEQAIQQSHEPAHE
jgi:hypothetical protein